MTTIAERGGVSPGLMVLGSSALLITAMFASFAPTPLYPIYAERWGVGAFGTSVAFSGYPVGVVLVVLGVGGLSDRFGRRRTLLVATALVVTALIVTSQARDLAMLTTGRLLQGMGTGLVGSTAAAALLDFHPRGARAGTFLHSMCTTIGMGVGPLTSGWLVEHSPHPLVAPYLVIAVLAIVPASLLLTARREIRGPTDRGIFQPIRIPHAIWLPFSVAAVAMIALNGCTGLFGAFSSRIVEEGLQSSSPASTGRLITLLIVAIGVGQVAIRRMGTAKACIGGLVMITVGVGCTAVGVHTTSAIATVGGTVLIGLGGGLALLGSTRLIAEIAHPAQRAATYAAWMVVAFVSMAAAALLAGSVLHNADMTGVLLGAGVLAALLTAYAVVVTRRDWTALP